MNAQDILEAIHRKYPAAAIVPELTVNVPNWESGRGEGQVWQRRIDALMFESYWRTAIEIKVSRADVKRETYQKTEPWRRLTNRFIYAVPAGLVEHKPIHGAGLWWVHDDGRIEVKVKAIPNRTPEHLPQDVIQRLAYRATKTRMENTQ